MAVGTCVVSPKSYYAASSWRGWNRRCTSGVFSSGRVTQGVKAIPYTQLKHKGNGQSQTSSLGRPKSSANRSCTLLLYHESFAYFLWASGLLDLV
ncbi:hypothetical protein AVEN_108367-1 [Araneus ventricosus]|uniref:Uncharacterized protein n=1 Tax=Araneus ventricosus TaxID=182803 RepID=A0A4Y2CWZ2_ARAVE|nr:hypothetical protein AVEN_108367-1 [Araneus ventricosus]